MAAIPILTAQNLTTTMTNGYQFESSTKALSDICQELDRLSPVLRNVSGLMAEIKLNENSIYLNQSKINEICKSLEIDQETFEKFGYATEGILERILRLPEELTNTLTLRGDSLKLSQALKSELGPIKALGRRQEEARLRVFQTESTEAARQKEVLKDALAKARASYDSLKLVFGKGWMPFRKEGMELALGLSRLHELLGGKDVLSAKEAMSLLFMYLFELRKGQRPEIELMTVLETKNELAAKGVQLDKASGLESEQIYNWLTSIERHGLIGAYLKWSHKTSEMAKELFGQGGQDKTTMTRSLRALLKINESLVRLQNMPVAAACSQYCATETQLLEVLQQMARIQELAKENLEEMPTTAERQEAWVEMTTEVPLKYPVMMENGKILLDTLGWLLTGPDQIGMAIEKSKGMLNPNVPWIGAASAELVALRKELVAIEHELLEAQNKSYLITLFGVDVVENPSWLEDLATIFELTEQVQLDTSLILRLMSKDVLYSLLDALALREESHAKSRKIAKLYADVGSVHSEWALCTRMEIKDKFESLVQQVQLLEKLSIKESAITANDLAEALTGRFTHIEVH